MSTKILTFNPLAEAEVEKAEFELDRLLNRGWKIVTSIGGNRSGRQGGRSGLRTEREAAAAPPVSIDYIVLILHRRQERVTGSQGAENPNKQLNDRQRSPAASPEQNETVG
jgi:hypothetical protein